MVGAAFSCSLLVVGATIYSFQLYVVPFADAAGLTRAQANLGMIALSAGIIVWSPLVGRMLDRIDVGRLMAFGGLMLGVGLVTLATATSLGLILVAMVGPLALSIVCAGPLAGSTVVARWFQRRRGRAMGLAACSTAAGGLVMTPLGALLIGEFGWRLALRYSGVGTGALVILIALTLVRSRPTEDEVRAGGEWLDPEESPAVSGDAVLWSSGELIRSPTFWLIALGAGLLMGSDQALLISKIPYLLDIGIELQAASFLVACQSASAVVGKLGIGFAADRFHLTRLFAVVALAHLLLLAALIAQPSYWVLLTVFLVVGVAIGGVHPVLTMLIGAAFGSRSYGSAYGLMNVLLQSIGMGAVFFIGSIFDRTGDYTVAFWIFGGVVFIAILLIARVRLPGDDLPASSGSVSSGA